MSARPVVLGVDVGTTATKVVALDAAGRQLGAGRAGYALDTSRPGRAVQDPEAIRDAVVAAIRGAADEVAARGARVAGIAFSAALHTLLALDRDGRPLTESVTWADERAGPQAARLAARPGGDALRRRTGTPLHPMSPLAKLAWFAECEPRTAAAAARWVGIKEYVLAGLTGEHVVDHSVASATGLLANATLDWDDEALRLAGVTPAQLSTLVPAVHVVTLRRGAAASLGVDAATPIVVGAGDGPLANLGAGALRPGVADCSIGTSGALRVIVDRPRADAAGALFCYALVPGRWAAGGAVNNGGAVLAWAGDALAPDLGDHPEPALLALAARAPAGADGLMMAPQLLGERAPRWATAPVRGAYVGLSRSHRREHLVRAALEGVCLQLSLVAAAVRDAGVEITEVRATGGFAASPFWCQLLADVLGRPIVVPAHHEGSAVGAALLGLTALGMVGSLDEAADLVHVDRVVDPDPPAAALFARRRPVFAALAEALAPVTAALVYDRPMDTDDRIDAAIESLVAEEHRLATPAGEADPDTRHRRQGEVKVELDRLYDWKRQRQALVAAGRSPDEAHEREGRTVEDYLG